MRKLFSAFRCLGIHGWRCADGRWRVWIDRRPLLLLKLNWLRWKYKAGRFTWNRMPGITVCYNRKQRRSLWRVVGEKPVVNEHKKRTKGGWPIMRKINLPWNVIPCRRRWGGGGIWLGNCKELLDIETNDNVFAVSLCWDAKLIILHKNALLFLSLPLSLKTRLNVLVALCVHTLLCIVFRHCSSCWFGMLWSRHISALTGEDAAKHTHR